MAWLPSLSALSASLIPVLLLCTQVLANETRYIVGTNAAGISRNLDVDRYPALYSGDYADCLAGGSLLNITHYDAAYYADNMTVLFHLSGSTNLRSEYIMMYISVDAYGENRFDMTFDPCTTTLRGLCPMEAGTAVSAEVIIPVGVSDVQGIPDIALQIPDFEGSVSIRIFANSSQTEIGCFQAVMQNGASLSHRSAVSSTLGVFTLIALISSFAMAVYGSNIPQMRTHYGHALPVLVVFEIYQSIFFSGALNLNWPSVCVAWWSNFAWSAGMIHTNTIITSINNFVGVSGNSSQVGGAGSTVINNNGGLQQQIYGRSLDLDFFKWSSAKAKRAATGSESYSPDYGWAGNPVAPGLPTPGNWSGFAGELQELGIPVGDAFILSLLWLLILLAVVIASVVVFKWCLEGLTHLKRVRPDKLVIFRTHWLGYLGLTISRMLFIAYPVMLTLSLFQFAFMGSAAVTAIAALVFIACLVGGFGVAGYACFHRLRFGRYESNPDTLYLRNRKLFKIVPWIEAVRGGSLKDEEKAMVINSKVPSVPIFSIRYVDRNSERLSVHEDQDYIKRFGWLTAHYRRSAWWFFAVWTVYQFVRACFIGGAPMHPVTQVIGLFVLDLIVMILVVRIRPFEGSRNTAIAVYMLSFSKTATTGLSIAFLPSYNLPRIPATIVGFVIIIIQAFLTIALLILIMLGAISSYMSLTRNKEQFTPRHWQSSRVKYFQHLEDSAHGITRPKKAKVAELPEELVVGFKVTSVRRAPKIEDEDEYKEREKEKHMAGIPEDEDVTVASTSNIGNHRKSRANSMRSNHSMSNSNIPYGARLHRMSWTSKDFDNINEDTALDSTAKGKGIVPNSRRATMMSRVVSPPVSAIRPVSSLNNIRPTVSIDTKNSPLY